MLNWSEGGAKATGGAVQRARDVIAALPPRNAVAAVRAITEALESINAAADMALDLRYSEIQQLDAATVEHTQTLLREYLNTPRQKKLREGELWGSAYDCWRELATAYVRCVQRYAADPRSAVAFRVNVPVALARALRALRRQMQWTRLRYAAPGAPLWSGLASLYAFVESSNIDEGVLIYPGETTTIKQEFLKALMQSALSCESLQPPGQDLASAVVSQYAPLFVLSKKPLDGCTHWFDLKHPQAPARTTRAPQPGDDPRYFGAGAAVGALEKTLAQFESSRDLPPGLAGEGRNDPIFVKSIFEHVYQDWSGKTQARQHERQKINARITVVPGFKDTMRCIEFAVSDSLDFTDQPGAESWVVDDVSTGGYGAVIPSVAGDWVEVGSLVGIEGDTPRAWRVGVVRRVERLGGNQQRVGVQLLGSIASLVRMRREDEREAQVGLSQRVPLDFAILLTADVQAQSEAEVLVRSGSFTSMDNVYMLTSDKSLVLRPMAVVERNAACERVAFRVIGPAP